MPLTTAEVEHIAELARLSLTEQEKTLFQDQLSAILDYAAVLQGVDTSAVPPTATVLPLRNIMRDDVVAPSLPTEDVLANAPAASDGYFKVKSILEAGLPAPVELVTESWICGGRVFSIQFPVFPYCRRKNSSVARTDHP